MSNLQSWCICLFISSAVVGCQLPVASAQTKTPKTSGQQTTDNRPPTTDNHLPCLSSESDCLRTLGNIAINNSREIRTLDQAIQLQKKKLWTSWLSADGLNPLAIGLRIARNVAGGGDRAALKLEIARVEVRRAELETNLHQAILQSLLSYENARQQVALSQTRLAAQHVRVSLLETGYRLGSGTTPEMLQEWERRDELQSQLLSAKRSLEQALRQLNLILCLTCAPP